MAGWVRRSSGTRLRAGSGRACLPGGLACDPPARGGQSRVTNLSTSALIFNAKHNNPF